jgi:cation:H+ antiporter
MEWLVLFLTLGAMLLGANWLVRGCTSLAQRFGVSEFIVSFLIIGIGTSLPELMVAILGGARDMGTLVLANTVSSNIFNTLGILGVGALLYPIVLQGHKYISDMIFMCIAGVALTVMIFLGPIGFWEGLILLGLFFAYLMWSWRNRQSHRRPPKRAIYSSLKTLLLIVSGIFAIVFAGDYFMNALQLIIADYNLSQTLAGILIVAPGTSIPELLVTIIASFRKQPQIAVGNIIGSSFVNIVLIVAVGALISDLDVTAHLKYLDIWVMLGAFALLCFNLLRGRNGGISRKWGAMYVMLCAIALVAAILLR